MGVGIGVVDVEVEVLVEVDVLVLVEVPVVVVADVVVPETGAAVVVAALVTSWELLAPPLELWTTLVEVD